MVLNLDVPPKCFFFFGGGELSKQIPEKNTGFRKKSEELWALEDTVPGMAILAIVPTITVDGIAPLVRRLDVGTGRRPVLELLRASPPVLVVVELGAGVPLPKHTQVPTVSLKSLLAICFARKILNTVAG